MSIRRGRPRLPGSLAERIQLLIVAAVGVDRVGIVRHRCTTNADRSEHIGPTTVTGGAGRKPVPAAAVNE